MKLKLSTISISIAAILALSGCGSDDNDTTTSTDNTPPVITLVGNESIEVVYNAKFGDLGAQANDDTDGAITVTTQGTVDTSTAGTYEITYTATDASGNSSQATRTVVVLENTSQSATITTPEGPFSLFFDGALKGADYWSEEPQILSAGMGFDGIIAIDVPEITMDTVIAAGGAWSSDIDCGTGAQNYTTASTRDQVANGYIHQTPYGELKNGAIGLDGLPIVLSWPIDTSTLSLTDFQFTLNTGDIVRPWAIGPLPNFEENERNTPVAFGEFGNRLPSDHPDARFPIKLEIVEDDTPLIMVGPGGKAVSAVGLTWETDSSPYDENNGPRLVGAKLNRIDGQMEGEGVSSLQPFLPANDATVLYDEGDFMLRMLTTGGFSPNGVSALKPNEFERFFRIHAKGVDGNTVIIDKVGEEYVVQSGTLRVVGLSDLGRPEIGDVTFDACYSEDRDNYIDIILVGDEAAARNITTLEIPSLEEGYSAFYNPGGPGSTPFEGVTYSAPGPRDLESVIIALDDPMRVTYTPGSDKVETPENLMTFQFDGIEREYLLDVSSNYSGDKAVPLLFDFHGGNGTAQQQYSDSQFSQVSETENFILVTPQSINGWNVTGFPLGGDANDLGFIDALIKELSSSYNIDSNRIYATGFSLGGFFSFELACQYSDTFAAIAPVSGVMTPTMAGDCKPERPIPVLQTHGSADRQLPYAQAQTALQWWIDFNQTDVEPVITDLEDTFPENGTTIQRYVYANGTNGVSVEHLRIEGGQHIWPGSEGDSDINLAEEIWRFLSRYDVNGTNHPHHCEVGFF
ncbi:immunoglobulin-like domain-containing protein [Paraferrimonas sp. SM1919]|uniref:immunoglobulin-like domain-containing protein n=1 Tax=Paraferrimonas sp. SM1919 TaxID=2662263 RepID=UPI0013D00C18|nr:immunoglobulin-like domain-containing protein [Paraferrimonas sp. SM1919]